MRLRGWMVALTLVLAGSVTEARTPAAPQSGGYHVDEERGFKIKPPRGWEAVPLKVGEVWQAGKFLSKKEDHFTDKNGGWTWTHNPRLTVIAFWDELVDGEVEKDLGGDIKIKLEGYRDYEDYLDRTYTGGGFHVAERETRKVDGAEVTCLLVKVERAAYDGPKRIIAWIFQGEGVDYAVEAEVLEKAYDKRKSEIERAMKSFRVIERTSEGIPGLVGADARESTSRKELRAMTPFERRVHRQEDEKRLHESARQNLPEGWEAKEYGRILVLNHASDSVAERMVDRAEATLAWLDDSFPFIGKDEYVRAPILRICKDWQEENSYRRGGDGWWGTGLEVVTHDDGGGNVGWEVEAMNQQLLRIWFQDKDRDLYFAMPSWLESGLSQVVANAHPKGRKMELRVDAWDRDKLRELERNGTAKSPRELLSMGKEEYWDDVFDVQKQAGALVRFFLTEKRGKHREVFENYMRNLKLVTDRMRTERGGDDGDDDEDEDDGKPKTEEEEDEAFKKRRNAWKQSERAILDEVFQRTFRGWSDRDWEKFEKAYLKSLN